eukprot:1693327-Pleurochrysis_carterae.AAC.1
MVHTMLHFARAPMETPNSISARSAQKEGSMCGAAYLSCAPRDCCGKKKSCCRHGVRALTGLHACVRELICG